MSSMNIQPYLICPITLELFNDPVIAEDGNTYEKKAITEWIIQYGTSPITRKSLSIDRLISNRTIKDTVETFKQQHVQPSVNTMGNHKNDDKRQSLENLDVLCRYCGSTQQFKNVKQHQLQCSSNPVNIVPFNIADNEIIFATSQQTPSNSKSFRHEKIFSFTNPLARRTTNPTATDVLNQTPVRHDPGNPTNAELLRASRFSQLKKSKITCFSAIFVAILLTTIAITLGVYYGKRQKSELLTAVPTTFTWTPSMVSTTTTATTTTMIVTSIMTSTSTPTMTSTSTPTTISTTTASSTSSLPFTLQPPCASAEWNSNGTTVASNLDSPHDIAIDSQDNIIVADTENHRLQKYFTNGTTITLYTDVKAVGIFIDKFDSIYVASSFRDEVMVLNSNGELITTIDGSNITDSFYHNLDLESQAGLYVDKNNSVYISDTGHDRVIKYFIDLSYGIIVAGEKGQGSELNQLNGPYGIYVDEVNEIGAIYICDHQNHRIQKWLSGASEGITVAMSDEQLRAPMSILLQSTVNQVIMFISSFNGNQVLKWIPYAQETESIVVGASGHMGTELDRLFAPRGIKFDKYWNLFVADAGNDRVEKFLFNTSSCENNN